MWAAEWSLIEELVPIDGQVRDGLMLIAPPAGSRQSVADFPSDVIEHTRLRMRDLHGYDRATRARLAEAKVSREREERKERLRRQQAHMATNMHRALRSQARNAPRRSKLRDLLEVPAELTNEDEWTSGDGWPMEDPGEDGREGEEGRVGAPAAGAVVEDDEEEEIAPVRAGHRCDKTVMCSGGLTPDA